jgi:hypothetical protein
VAVDPRKGWLARLFGKSYERRMVKTITSHRERLSLTVPAAHADAVRTAVERWLEGRGVTASVTSTESEGKAHLHAELGDADAAKVDFSSDEVQAELEKLLSDAMA